MIIYLCSLLFSIIHLLSSWADDNNSESRMSISIFILFICLCQCLQGELTKKQTEDIEEIREDQREKDLAKIYTNSRANQFLTVEKCLQRMKCPDKRRNECHEECRAGNTEEEIEEHVELTRDEHRSSFSRPPKQKFERKKNKKEL